MILLALVCAVAAGYQAVALLATVAHALRKDPVPADLPPFSILKPVAGADDGFAGAIRTHARIAYPEFELLFGVGSLDDAAVPVIEELRREYPHLPIRILECPTDAPNAKVGKLEALAAAAKHGHIAVNDADISVPPDYLHRLAAVLAEPGTGLVTCLYRAEAGSFPAAWEALGIATDFAPSTLVAPFVGVREFGLGSTLAFRAADLRRAGGFTAIRDYIADDYQVGKRISAAGLRVRMARMPVATWLEAGTWTQVWSHQVRWARTIRLSRGLYYGLPVTHASLWALAALLVGWWWTAAGLLALRLSVGLASGLWVLQDAVTARWWWLMPLRDLWGFAVWVAGAVGSTVEWRGRTISLDREGRIVARVLR